MQTRNIVVAAFQSMLVNRAKQIDVVNKRYQKLKVMHKDYMSEGKPDVLIDYIRDEMCYLKNLVNTMHQRQQQDKACLKYAEVMALKKEREDV